MMGRAICLAGLLGQGCPFSTLPSWQQALKIDKSESALARIKEKSGVLVDKTSHLVPLVTSGPTKVHIAAPFGFGKTSTLWQVADLYRPGADVLFAGTNIEKSGFFKDWKPRPFAIFDLSGCTDSATLETNVRQQIAEWAKVYDVVIPGGKIEEQMKALLNGIRKNTGTRVVVLIDDYDIPLRQRASEIKSTLNWLYWNIKSSGVLEKGIVFEALNKHGAVGTYMEETKDISEDPEILPLFGFTEEEVRDTLFSRRDAQYYDKFASTIPEVAEASSPEAKRDIVLERLKLYYGGFRFYKYNTPVYNPYSILQARAQTAIKPYFATPEAIPEMKKLSLLYPFITFEMPKIWISKNNAWSNWKSVYSVEIRQMWNLGLLTFEKYEFPSYCLKLPNEEVKAGLQKLAKESLILTSTNQKRFAKVLAFASAGNFTALAPALQKALPKTHYTFLKYKSNLKHFMRENFAKLGAAVKIDVKYKYGKGEKLDLRLETAGKVYIFELGYKYRSYDTVQRLKNKEVCLDDMQAKDLSEVYGVGVELVDRKFRKTEVRIVRATLKSGSIEYEEVATTNNKNSLVAYYSGKLGCDLLIPCAPQYSKHRLCVHSKQFRVCLCEVGIPM